MGRIRIAREASRNDVLDWMVLEDARMISLTVVLQRGPAF